MSNHEIIPLLEGVPITSNRGALGWSSATAIRTQGHRILVDTGSYGDRRLLLSRLEHHGLHLHSFDAIVLTHFHFDHMQNAELFPHTRLLISTPELDYILSDEFRRAQDPYVPLPHVGFLRSRLFPITDGQEIAPGLQSVYLPGHTPGSMGLFLPESRLLLTGDAVKNRRDYAHNIPPPCFGAREDAIASLHKVKKLATRILPGHDVPFSSFGRDGTRLDRPHTSITLTVSDRPEQPDRLFSIFNARE